MTEVNWGLLKMPDVGLNALAAFEQGQKWGLEARRRKGLADYAKDPHNPQTINALLAVDPETGFKAMEMERKRVADARDAETRGALSDYAISAYGPRAPQPTSPGAPQATVVGGPANPQDAGHGPAAPDYSFLGEPQTDADHAFLRALKADPVAALKLQSGLRDNMVERLKAEQDFYGFAVSRLAGVSDEAGYQAALDEADRILRPMGGDVRAHVPPNYPGPEGLGQLRLRALDVKDQITTLLNQANVEADNARADRNTDSLIQDRNARRQETQRYHDVTVGERRRSNDQADRTRRRGQDMAAGRKSARPTATGPNGEKVEFDGKNWVPIK